MSRDILWEGPENTARMQGQDELGVGRQLMMAASNGDAIMVRNLLQHHPRSVIDVDQIDEDGSAPLIYASCFVSSA